jgi:hypothetical protein
MWDFFKSHISNIYVTQQAELSSGVCIPPLLVIIWREASQYLSLNILTTIATTAANGAQLSLMVFRTGSRFPRDIFGRLPFIQISDAHNKVKPKPAFQARGRGGRQTSNRGNQSSSRRTVSGGIRLVQESPVEPCLSPSLFAQYDQFQSGQQTCSSWSPSQAMAQDSNDNDENQESSMDSSDGQDDEQSVANSDTIAIRNVKQSPLFTLDANDIDNMSPEDIVTLADDNPSLQLVHRLIQASVQATFQPTISAMEAQLATTTAALHAQGEINEDLTAQLNDLRIAASATSKSIGDIKASMDDALLRNMVRDYSQIKADYDSCLDVIQLYTTSEATTPQEQKELALTKMKAQRHYGTMQQMIASLNQECTRLSVPLTSYISPMDVAQFSTQNYE